MPFEQRSCAEVTEFLVGYDEIDLCPVGVQSHIDACLRCQAELAGFRRLRRSMLDLAVMPGPVDPALEHRILFGLDAIDDRSEHRLVKATAVTIGGLAAAAGVIAVASKQIRSMRMAG